MFTGIVQMTSRVATVRTAKRIQSTRIEKPRSWRLSPGESVNVNGVCSTVIASDSDHFTVEYILETLKKTNLAQLESGKIVNLERSMRLRDLVGGQLIQGHVDATARLDSMRGQGRSRLLVFRLPTSIRRFVATHGSIAVNGVSLTVARLVRGTCTVALIPHTLRTTNLGVLKRGDTINIEVDLLARYAVAGKRTSVTVGRNAKRRGWKKG
ncbi:riboflavin synthase [Candidatus Kaiserbacteria bacterium]|nr:riboflavin synthase [Candidatus Kaiserbacteria bacterium]